MYDEFGKSDLPRPVISDRSVLVVCETVAFLAMLAFLAGMAYLFPTYVAPTIATVWSAVLLPVLKGIGFLFVILLLLILWGLLGG